MRIRYKLLILLLTISVVPMLLLRINGQMVMSELGEELAERARSSLIHRTSLELERLVEDHARVLRREMQLVEALLRVQALEVERALAGPAAPSGVGEPMLLADEADSDRRGWSRRSRPWTGRGRDEPSRRENLSRRFCIDPGGAACSELSVSYDRMALRRLPGASPDSELLAERASRIAAATDSLRRLALDNPRLVFWQQIVLPQGLQAVYPGLSQAPPGHDPRLDAWYRKALDSNKPVWSPPEVDALTRQVVLTASMPVALPDGGRGVTAISVQAAIMLHENEHIRMLSDNVDSLLVRADNNSAGTTPELSLLARDEYDQPLHWRMRLPEHKTVLASNDDEELQRVAEDILAHRSGVRGLPYEGRPSLWAYGILAPFDMALMLVIPQEDVVREAQQSKEFVLSRVNSQIRFTGLVLALVLASVVVAAVFGSRGVTRNLDRLTAAALRLASGDFSVRSNVRTNDEFGELGRSFDAMIPALEERLRIKQSLNVAREVQQNLLPGKTPELPGLDIAGVSRYCDETGGDFFDFMTDNGSSGRFLSAVGDISGHGIPAALLMASARAYLRATALTEPSLAETVTTLNRLVLRDTFQTGHFLTMFLIRWDVDEGRLSWVNAGHDAALLVNPEDGSVSELTGRGPALGVDPDFAYEEGSMAAPGPGQVLALGTDGIWEARNPEGEMFGRELFLKILRDNASSAAEEIVRAVLEAVDDFGKGRPQEDDVTLVVVKARPRPQPGA